MQEGLLGLLTEEEKESTIIDSNSTTPRTKRTEEEQIAIDTDYGIYELKTQRIIEGIEAIFGDQTGISQDQYRQILSRIYSDPRLNLNEYGKKLMPIDFSALCDFIPRALSSIEHVTETKTGKMLVLGCGKGREAIMTIEIARLLGVTEITFLDLMQDHVDATKELITNIYGNNGQSVNSLRKKKPKLKLKYEVSDFMKFNPQPNQYDLILSLWFVSNEISNDFSSPENFHNSRQMFRKQVYKLLSKRGVFVNDTPYAGDPGTYYNLMLLKSSILLREKGILAGVKDVAITNFSQLLGINDFVAAFPRYIPHNGSEIKQMDQDGFDERFGKIIEMPSGIKPIKTGTFSDRYGSQNTIHTRIREEIEQGLNKNQPISHIVASLIKMFQVDIYELLDFFPHAQPFKKITNWQKR